MDHTLAIPFLGKSVHTSYKGRRQGGTVMTVIMVGVRHSRAVQ